MDEQLSRILETAGAIHAEAAADIRDSAWMPKEIAAQLAEGIACVNVPEGDGSFLNGWTGACEAIAAAIRDYRSVKMA